MVSSIVNISKCMGHKIIFSFPSILTYVLGAQKNLLSGFIRLREMSGKFKFFQGQGIVREFYAVSMKNEVLLKCQGNVREFLKL